MRSLLRGVTPDDIRLDPFPHVVKRDVLDDDIHLALNQGFPPFSAMAWADKRIAPGSNRRYQLSAWFLMNNPDLPQIWKDFVALHASPAFFAEVVALFAGHWPAALRDRLGGDPLGHPMGLLMRDHYDRARILQDARPEINTPVLDHPSSSRGPHLDTANRLFTCLYYLRHPDDDAVGGDLELFRWKNGPIATIELDTLPADSVEVVATIPYRANQLVIFPQGIDAIHGVGIRQPTPHTRRYAFISAEIQDDWLVSPAAMRFPAPAPIPALA